MIRNTTMTLPTALLVTTLAWLPSLGAQVEQNEERRLEITFGEDGISMENALQWASKSTGLPMMHQANDFRSKPHIMLTGKIEVEESGLLEFWQGIFKTQGFAMIRVSRGGSEFIKLESIDSSRTLKTTAKYVEEDDIAACAARPGEVIMTTIKLHHVPVQSVRGAVTQLLTNRTAEFAQEIQGSNSLMVVGFGPTVHALYHALKTMDVPSTASQVVFEAIPLAYADAGSLTPVVSALIEQRRGQRATPAQAGHPGHMKTEPRIIADKRSNRLLVHAVAEDLAQIKSITKTLDVKPVDHQSTTIFTLEHARAFDVIRTIEDLYGAPKIKGRSSGPSPFRIVHDERTNSLFLRCSKSQMDEIRPIIASLDREIEDK